MQLIDEAAFICATRFSRKKMVTVSSDRIDFKHAIPAGTIVQLVSRVAQVGKTSLRVNTTIYVEEMYKEGRVKAIESTLTFVAIGENKKPIQVLDNW